MNLARLNLYPQNRSKRYISGILLGLLLNFFTVVPAAIYDPKSDYNKISETRGFGEPLDALENNAYCLQSDLEPGESLDQSPCTNRWEINEKNAILNLSFWILLSLTGINTLRWWK